MKYGFVLFFISLTFVSLFSQASTLSGVVTTINGEPAIFATVALYKSNTLLTGTDTDFDGNYIISNLEPGFYRVEFSYLGFKNVLKTIQIKVKTQNILSAQFVKEYRDMTTSVTECFNKPALFDLENFNSGMTFTRQNGFLKPRI